MTFDQVLNIFNGLACWAFDVAWTLLIIFVIWAGIRYMLAGGSEEKTTQAKKNFYGVLIGVLVILGVNVILSTVAQVASTDFPVSLIPFQCNK